jgi:uncharacterized membrane protein YkoI
MRPSCLIVLPIAALASLVPMLCVAAERDQEVARRALEKGEIRPLAEILAGMRGRLQGELVGIELERKAGKWVYEFTTIGEGGQKIKVFVDGQTGQVFKPMDD